MVDPKKGPAETDDEKLDDTVDDSFPASDPPSTTPETGTGRPDEADDAHGNGKETPVRGDR